MDRAVSNWTRRLSTSVAWRSAFMLMMLASPAVEVQDDVIAGVTAAEAEADACLISQLSHPLNWMNEISIYPPVRVQPSPVAVLVTTGPGAFDICIDVGPLDSARACAACLNKAALEGIGSLDHQPPLRL